VDAIYQVYIEGTRDASPGGAAKVAQAISARYGFPVADLEARLQTGRFRVKSKVDRVTAERFAADLRRLGAECVVVDGNTGQTVATGSPGGNPPRAATPSTPAYQSGLAAAFAAGRESAPDLGALESGVFSLASLDGDPDQAGPAPVRDSAASFTPPPPAPRASAPAIAPPPRPSSQPAPRPPSAVDFFGSEDPFAPPTEPPVVDLALDVAAPPAKAAPKPAAVEDGFAPPAAETAIDVALDVVSPVPRTAGTMAPPAAAQPAPVRPTRAPSVMGGTAAMGSTVAPGSVLASARRLGRNDRARFVAGVALAIVLGFIPAHVVASVRQDAAFTEIDARVTMRQAEVTTRDEWNQLDVLREAQLERKRAAHRNIALFALLVWGSVGGVVAYVWFRRIDWSRLTAGTVGTGAP
jgi:hypothetical protein